MRCLQGCFCTAGYTLETFYAGQVNETKSCVQSVVSADPQRDLIIGTVSAVSGVTVIIAVVIGLLWLLRVQVAAFTLQRAKKKGPPGA